MNQQRMMNQVNAVFGIFMTLFYIGIGLYLVFTNNLYIVDKTLLKIIGFTFAIYGLYRGFRTYQQLLDAFFRKGDDEN